jgi:hypothetical protein
MSAFLFIDVDGYCASKVRADQIVSAHADGYRARELGWAIFSKEFRTGSVYFYDRCPVKALDQKDLSVRYVNRFVHGLPIAPVLDDFKNEIAIPSDRLLCAIKTLCVAAEAHCDGGPVVVVHKGGNEGIWTRQTYPKAIIIDLAELGCPKVNNICKSHPEWLSSAGAGCQYHSLQKQHKKKQAIVHCPNLEIRILAMWVALSNELLPSM